MNLQQEGLSPWSPTLSPCPGGRSGYHRGQGTLISFKMQPQDGARDTYFPPHPRPQFPLWLEGWERLDW